MPRITNKSWLMALISLAIILVVGVVLRPGHPPLRRLDGIRVGVVPDEGMGQLRHRYMPLVTYLARETGEELHLIIPDNYEQLVEMVRDGRVDLAYFGGFTFVKAQELYHVEPLVMRDTDTRFVTYLLIRAERKETRLAQLERIRFAFGSELSNSGHIMPRYYLAQRGIVPETFFSEVRYSSQHDRTAYWVRDGVVDVGAVNAEIVDQMFRDGRLDRDQIRIFARTRPYSNYVWGVSATLSEPLKTRLRDAFMKLSYHDPAHREILDGVGAGCFLPAGNNEFSALRQIARDLRFLEGAVER